MKSYIISQLRVHSRICTHLEEFGQVWRADLSQHVALSETLPSSQPHVLPPESSKIEPLNIGEHTISANSASRTQNFSSCTSRKATGTPSLSTPNTVEALLSPLSKSTSLPILMFCSCARVPVLHIDTSGCHACDVIVLRIADTGAVTMSRTAMVFRHEAQDVVECGGWFRCRSDSIEKFRGLEILCRSTRLVGTG
jgi:hypothetical protein